MAGSSEVGAAGARAAQWIQVLNAGELSEATAATMLLPGAVVLHDVHTAEGRRSVVAAHAGGVPWVVLALHEGSPGEAHGVVGDAVGRRWRLGVRVEAAPPHRISSVALLPEEDTTEEQERPPSMTAVMAAAARGAHLLWDGPEPVFTDSLALRLVPGGVAEQVRQGPAVGPGRGVAQMMSVRSRVAEDVLRAAHEGGVRQYVVLGAGLDSFACARADQLPGVRVFEVDQADTQRWKRARLAAAGVEEPPCVAFVAVDFTTDDLADRLGASGFDPGAPAVFAWLGVTYYLSSAEIERTLRAIATGVFGTELVLDYVDPTLEDVVPGAARLVATVGEPRRSSFTSTEMATLLGGCGWTVVRDLTPRDAGERYYADRAGVRPAGQFRVVHAHLAAG